MLSGFELYPRWVPLTFEPYHDVDQLLEPSKRNDKSLNQVNDLNKNCTLKRHSDINNSATNSHIELDNNLSNDNITSV